MNASNANFGTESMRIRNACDKTRKERKASPIRGIFLECDSAQKRISGLKFSGHFCGFSGPVLAAIHYLNGSRPWISAVLYGHEQPRPQRGAMPRPKSLAKTCRACFRACRLLWRAFETASLPRHNPQNPQESAHPDRRSETIACCQKHVFAHDRRCSSRRS